MCSSAPATPSTQTSTTDLPDWAKPYAKETLAKTKALTDINQNPYQKYGGERIAGFQPMQEQAFKTMSGMDASPEGFAKGIGTYMSPYMQNVVDIQKREAGRQSDIAGTQQQAQATQAGAFGGGRDAIMRAERERNLGQQMGDIQARGSQAAFDQASNQFRQGITQQSGLAQMQGQMGQQQQQQAQRPLDMAYQDFQNQQNYPYKQLGFMSDMVNRLPLGQKSTAQLYEAPGSTMGQLAGLGMGAYGLSKMMAAEGGLMQSYADGGLAEGGDINSPQNIEAILARLSDAQLQQAKEAALNRRDINEAQMIDAEIAQRASMRQGTEQMPQGIAPALPEQFADGMEQSMATGGIVAFADRGEVKDEEASSPFYDLLGRAARAINPALSGSKAEYESKQSVMDKARELRNEEPGFFSVMKPSEREAKLKDIEKQRKNLAAVNEKVAKGDYKATDTLKKEPAKQKLPQMSPEDMAKIDARNAAIKSGVDVDMSGKVVQPQPPPAKSLERQYADVKSGPKPSKAQVQSAVEQLAEKQGLSPDSTQGVQKTAQEIRKELGAENQPIIDEMRKMIEGQKTDVEAMKSQGLSQALAEFGFKMAANASRPGARFLESASSAAPTLAAASAKTQELITASQQNYAKLRMDQTKYEVALQKNDMQTAAIQAGQIAQGQQQDKLLKFQIAKAKDELELENRKHASTTAYQQASLSRHETISSLTREIMQNEGLPYGQALEKAARLYRPAGYAADTRAVSAGDIQLQKDIEKIDDFYRPLMAFEKDPAKLAALQAKRDAEVRAKMQQKPTSSGGATGNAPPAQGVNSGQWGDLRVKQ